MLDDKVLSFLNICNVAHIRPPQFYALFPRILIAKARDFHFYHITRTDDFGKQYSKIKLHFEHEIHRSKYFTDWASTNFEKLQAEHRDRGPHEILEMLIEKLQLCQRALGPKYMNDEQLGATIISPCHGVPELEYVLMSPAKKCEQLFGQQISSIEVRLSRSENSIVMHSIDLDSIYYVDRRYNENRKWLSDSQNLHNDKIFIKGGQGRIAFTGVI